MKTLLSGIQPSGKLTLGNYLGAIKNFVSMQDENDCFFCIVDLHAIVTRQDPVELNKNILELAAYYIASGIEPKSNTIFVQSMVPQHSELSWILNTFTSFGELNRMTQFKDKSNKIKNDQNISVGLFGYPVLMAADILLYDTNIVPVGIDQKQHLELTRNIAERVNNLYNDEIFVIPDPYIPEVSSKIMDLQDPSIKMSKSTKTDKGCIYLSDTPEIIRDKIKKAITDSDGKVFADWENKPGITNLMSIYSSLTGKNFDLIQKEFENNNYGHFKSVVAEAIVDELSIINKRYNDIMSNRDELLEILSYGAKKAISKAEGKIRDIKKIIGLGI